jgi:membrane protease YdiL (CAAX protease family)
MIEETLLNVIIKAIPYTILGGFFAYTYTKTENITTNMMAHAINNIMAVALMCLYL